MDVVVPHDLWDDDREGVLVSWVYQEGAQVTKDALIAELMVEKIQLELVAPATGRLVNRVAPETVVRRGDVIASIES